MFQVDDEYIYSDWSSHHSNLSLTYKKIIKNTQIHLTTTPNPSIYTQVCVPGNETRVYILGLVSQAIKSEYIYSDWSVTSTNPSLTFTPLKNTQIHLTITPNPSIYTQISLPGHQIRVYILGLVSPRCQSEFDLYLENGASDRKTEVPRPPKAYTPTPRSFFHRSVTEKKYSDWCLTDPNPSLAYISQTELRIEK